jgi:tetratricopeptide (TPR) repeat protein
LRKPTRPVRRRRSAASKGSGEASRATLPIDVQPGAIEETLRKVTETLRQWANTGRYTKVRFKFRGKPLLPDLPLAAVVAAEGLTFYWTGILRALLVNVAGRSVLDVELVNDSEQHVQKGKEELLAGEVDRAISEFRTALAKQHDNPRAQLNLGIALKLKGDRPSARSALEKARTLDPDGPVGKEAERLLQGLGGGTEIGGSGPA